MDHINHQKFKVGDVIRSIPTGMVFEIGWEGVIISTKYDGIEFYYQIRYFDPQATDAAYLREEEMEKLNDT